ncbi:hypothetical protein RUND412_007545 [Rhizina undulata]
MEDEDALEDAIGDLLDLSLVGRKGSESQDSFWIHPLVQAGAREHTANSALRLKYTEGTITLIASAIPVNPCERSLNHWIFERRISNHLNVCHDNISLYFSDSENPQVFAASTKIASVYKELGYFKRAVELYQIALAGYEKSKSFARDHPSTLDTMHDMAIVFSKDDAYEEALTWYWRTLIGRQKALGSAHPATLDTALEWYQRALTGKLKEQTLGSEHLSTLDTVNDMAIVLDRLGNHDEALERYKTALAGREKALGREHPLTLEWVNCIGLFFQTRGRYDEAIERYQRVLAGYEKTLWHDHPSTLETALAGYENAFESDYPSIIRIVNDIAIVYLKQERYDETLVWYKRGLVRKEMAFGCEHPSTLDTLNNIVRLLKRQGRYQEALECYWRVLTAAEVTLESEQLSALENVNDMAI